MYYLYLTLLTFMGFSFNSLLRLFIAVGLCVLTHFFVSYRYQIICLSTLLVYWVHHQDKKITCAVGGIFILLFPYIKTTCYQMFYGVPVSYDIPHPLDYSVTLLENQEKKEFRRGKYTIEYLPRAKIDLFARVVYVDYIDHYVNYIYFDRHPLYDTISPLDVSVFIKSLADNWKTIKVTHDARVLYTYADNLDEHENIHIIPANETIYKGFSTVKRGDIVNIKGYLIDWNGTEDFSYVKFETALNFFTPHKYKYGGQTAWLCMQFMVTELYANGYLFK